MTVSAWTFCVECGARHIFRGSTATLRCRQPVQEVSFPCNDNLWGELAPLLGTTYGNMAYYPKIGHGVQLPVRPGEEPTPKPDALRVGCLHWSFLLSLHMKLGLDGSGLQLSAGSYSRI